MGKHRREDRDTSSSEDSESSHERKRHKKEKKEKKDKHRKHKNKHSKDKDKDGDREQERLVKEARRFLKKQLKSKGPEAAMAAVAVAGGRDRGGGRAAEPPAPPYDGPIQEISSDDYFLKNAEFAAWLKEWRGKFFSEQSTEDNRSMFEEFVEAWNGRRLPARFYRGEVGGGGGAGGLGAQRTGFNWAIKGGGGGAAALAGAGAVGMAAALDDDLDLKEQARQAALAERQQQRKQAKEWLDDQVPKLAGKDKQLEEKRARRELAKAGAGDSPEHLARGMDVMGGGDDSFQAARAREAARHQQRGRFQAARQAEVQHKLAAAQAAEADKMAQFKALLAAGPIQIAKRQ